MTDPYRALPSSSTGITEAQTILNAGMAIAAGNVIKNPNPKSDDFVIIPEAHKVEYIAREALPRRKQGITVLHDAESFIAFFNRHKDGARSIYAALNPLGFIGLLNEHSDESAAWRDFGCRYTPVHSPEWKEWIEHSGKKFESNDQFAVWLEDNLADVTDPPNSSLLEIALNFRVNQAASFSNAVRLSDGDTQFSFTNTVEGSSTNGQGGQVKIPEIITIDMPVFEGANSPKYELKAKFRYRLSGGRLNIWFELVRPHKVVEAAFKAMVDQIQTATKETVLFGTP